MKSVRTLARYLEAGIHASDWYERANASLTSYAMATGHCPNLVADVLALVSPRKQVAESVVCAKRYLESGSLVGLLPGVVAQFRHYLATGLIRGPKCRAFASALKGDQSALVLDTWMARALDIPHKRAGNVSVLRDAHKRFSRLASLTGLTIAQAQACVWAGIQGGECAYLEMAQERTIAE